jgi:AAHS family 4-hydroxybenzoate transporter-like MFS transporter
MVVSAMAPSLLEAYDWRGSFVFLGVLTFICVILIIAFLRDSPTWLLAKGKVEEAKKVVHKITSDAVELVAERHDTDTEGGGSIGVLHRTNLRVNIGVGVAFTSATAVAYGVLLWTTTLLTGKGWDLDDAAYAVAFAGLTSIFGSIAAGLIIQYFGSKVTMATFSGSLFVTLIALTIAVESMSGPQEGGNLVVVGLIGLAAALFSASIACMYAIMTHAYPPSCRSAGIGFGIFMGRFGPILSSGFGGTLLDLGDGSSVPFFTVLCVGSLLISAAAFVIDRPIPPGRKAGTA